MPANRRKKKPITKLEDLDVPRFDLVRRPANGRRFLLTKEDGSDSMTIDFSKILETAAEHEDKITEVMKSAELSDDGMAAALGAFRILSGYREELPDSALADMAKAAGWDETPVNKGQDDGLKVEDVPVVKGINEMFSKSGKTAKAVAEKMGMGEDDFKKALNEGAFNTEQMAKFMAAISKEATVAGKITKEDGSLDYDAMGKELGPIVKGLVEKGDAQDKVIKSLEESLKGEKAARVQKEAEAWVDANIPNAPGLSREEKVEMFKAHHGTDAWESISKGLLASEKAAAASDLFKQTGSAKGREDTAAEVKLEKLAKAYADEHGVDMDTAEGVVLAKNRDLQRALYEQDGGNLRDRHQEMTKGR